MNYAVKPVFGKITHATQRVCVPGSKSITARALLIAALARGTSVLCGIQTTGDCADFIGGLRSLGIDIKVNGNTAEVKGCGGKLPLESAEVYVGSAGTAARFLTALAALSNGTFRFTSSEQMKRRPISPLINSLRDMGASFTFHEQADCFPFTVRGCGGIPGRAKVDIQKSSQFLSALLICAVCAGKPFSVEVSGTHGMDYVRMTAAMMSAFGAGVECSDNVYTVVGSYSARRYDIEPDVSAACYFYAANKLLGTNICVEGVKEDMLQGDGKFISLLKHFDGGKIDMSSFSDQALTLAAVAPYLSRPTHICNIAHVRGQECDRIAAMAQNLTAMGVKVNELSDGIIIYPSSPVGCEIQTFGDHRVAMSFAITGLRCEGIVIKDCEVCGKTFASFFSVLTDLIARLTA